jgi:hypothetical protein
MDDEFSASAAGTAFLTLKTRDNMNKVINTTTTSRNVFHRNDDQTATEQCKPVSFIHDVSWFEYKQHRVMNSPVLTKDWAVQTTENVEWTQDCNRKDRT